MKKLWCSLLVCSLGMATTFASVPKVIFDSDMYTDFDDVGALALLHTLADQGECEILGTAVSTRLSPSSGMVELLNRFYGRGDLPIGATQKLGMGTDTDPGAKNSMPYRLYDEFVKADKNLKYPTSNLAPDANEVYRKLLANAQDGSVTIISVGFTTNMRRLLETSPDSISPLTGKELVARKVKAWFAMSCRYPNGFEYNSGSDAASSKIAFAEWPTPIYFLDFMYGVSVKCGVPVSKVNVVGNPVKDIFKRALAGYNEAETGHPAWDEITVLAAVRGWQRYFGITQGTFTMNDKGENFWQASSTGKHFVLTEKTSKAEVGKIIDELMAKGPSKK